MRLSVAVLLAALLRFVLILWSFHQDSTSSIKYTDVDYTVFSDAARCLVRPSSSPDCTLATGPLASLPLFNELGDPYARDTYRYTPLLAILAAPNILLHPAFGKVLFSLADLLVGVLLYALVRKRGVSSSKATVYVASIWLLNPIIANISTRGSAESVLGVFVVSVLALAERGRWNAAAVAFGLAVHFKIFPIIYGSSLLAAIGASKGAWITSAHIKFGLISFASFMALNGMMYALWGEPFLEHTFLYHIHRLDHRHNFSPYFYSYYLSTSPDLPSALWSSLIRHPLAAFLPQLGLSITLGFAFGAKDLAFAWLVQTLTFVTFNKVCTSQYFLWYLWFLPPVLPNLHIPARRGILLIAAWILSQALWLSQAFQLEMLAQPVYLRVWAAGVVFFGVNCWVIVEIVRGYRSGEDAGGSDNQSTQDGRVMSVEEIRIGRAKAD